MAFRLPAWLADVPLFPAICGREDWQEKGEDERKFGKQVDFSSWPLVGNEGINLYIGILGIHSFPTKGQLVFQLT